MKTLYFPLKNEWYKMIERGEKREEYREINPYWFKRLIDYDPTEYVEGDFVPGMYMKRGYVITSRGCPNRCWFCAVPKREGFQLRELPVTDGWIVTDDNLLACSTKHIDAVFEMLTHQSHRPQFVGGLEAAILTPKMSVRLRELRPESLWFAYDTPNDLEPLVEAGKMLLESIQCPPMLRALWLQRRYVRESNETHGRGMGCRIHADGNVIP